MTTLCWIAFATSSMAAPIMPTPGPDSLAPPPHRPWRPTPSSPRPPRRPSPSVPTWIACPAVTASASFKEKQNCLFVFPLYIYFLSERWWWWRNRQNNTQAMDNSNLSNLYRSIKIFYIYFPAVWLRIEQYFWYIIFSLWPVLFVYTGIKKNK